jgi:hypothetical protein
MISNVKRLLPGTAVIFVLLLYFFFDARQGGFPACPFYLVTNLYCPGCGSQRALSALLHGDFIDSLSYNPLLIIFLPLFLVAAYFYTRNLFYHDKKRIYLVYSNKFVFAVLILIVCFWTLRNIHGFEWLAPHD